MMKIRHIVLLAVVLIIFLARWRPDRFTSGPKPPENPSAPDSVRITQFYAAAPKIGLGDKTLLCYGVENAKSVRLEPGIEKMWPALTRCFDIVPTHTTRYTLMAESEKGEAVSETVTVEVGPPRPKLIEVSVNKLEVAKGEQVILCFKARNAQNYDVGGLKPVVLGGQPLAFVTPERGCFGDRPTKTKTYVVKVMSPTGEDREEVTVTVK
jgi:hypothetical protein